MPIEDTTSVGAVNLSKNDRKRLALQSKLYHCNECGPISEIADKHLIGDKHLEDVKTTLPEFSLTVKEKGIMGNEEEEIPHNV